MSTGARQKISRQLSARVVLAFLWFVGSTISSALESRIQAFLWLQFHAMETFGAYVAWISVLAPAALVAYHFDLWPIAVESHRRPRAILLALTLWIGFASILLALRSHGAGFITQSDVGAILAALTVIYWRAAIWQVKRRWLRWQPSR